MAQNFIACDREQAFLLPPDVREWLPEDHLAWFVLDAVAAMDLAAFYAAYREDGHGRPAYEPSMMVALLLYAYARGVRSSRAIERACVEDVACRVIAAQQRPDHATIARFVERHEQALAGLFGAVLGLCARGGAGHGRGRRDRRHQGARQRQPRRRRSTTSRSPGRSSRRPRPSTRPRTSSTAKRAATSCRPSWPAPGPQAVAARLRASLDDQRASRRAADPALTPQAR